MKKNSSKVAFEGLQPLYRSVSITIPWIDQWCQQTSPLDLMTTSLHTHFSLMNSPQINRWTRLKSKTHICYFIVLSLTLVFPTNTPPLFAPVPLGFRTSLDQSNLTPIRHVEKVIWIIGTPLIPSSHCSQNHSVTYRKPPQTWCAISSPLEFICPKQIIVLLRLPLTLFKPYTYIFWMHNSVSTKVIYISSVYPSQRMFKYILTVPKNQYNKKTVPLSLPLGSFQFEVCWLGNLTSRSSVTRPPSLWTTLAFAKDPFGSLSCTRIKRFNYPIHPQQHAAFEVNQLFIWQF